MVNRRVLPSIATFRLWISAEGGTGAGRAGRVRRLVAGDACRTIAVVRVGDRCVEGAEAEVARLVSGCSVGGGGRDGEQAGQADGVEHEYYQ